MNSSIKVATVRGIKIYVHWTWFLAIAFLTWTLGAYYHNTFHHWGTGTAYVVGLISGVLLFFTVLLHELGHSFTARALGVPVNQITLFIFGGVSSLTQEPKSARDEFMISFAGPFTSLLLAAIFFGLHAVTGGSSSQIRAVLGYLASVNLILAIFNLLPAFPLDGGRVFRSIVWAITGSLRKATRLASAVGAGIGALLICLGLVEAFVAGQTFGGIWLAFIGWFIYSGATASSKQAVLDQVLRGVDVADVMDPAPRGVPPQATIQSVVSDHLLDGRAHAVPVQQSEGSLDGLAALSDLRRAEQESWSTTPVSGIMTPAGDLITVAPSDDLMHAIQLMGGSRYHQLPVVDQGRLVGMLNRDHVMQYLHARQITSRQPQTAEAVGSRP
jgi:Zn-dependent protease/CBS domain-containing protein